MPASRSRTEHWRDYLVKLHERGGALEISVDRGRTPGEPGSADRGSDLVWRVKMVALRSGSIVVEPPSACGATIPLSPGVRLIAAMTIGQNRWMFHTRTLGHADGPPGHGRMLVLEMPTAVERCTRRGFFRISTADLRLPEVQCWPLLDPGSVGAAEAANRARINELSAAHASAGPAPYELDAPDSILLPEVGPLFGAHLLNLSGGGMGLLLRPEDGRALESRPFVWVRVDLRPDVPAPVAVTCRVAHTHIDSAQNLYAGLAFDFSHNPAHRKFVVDLFTAYVNRLQTRAMAPAAKAA